MELESFDSIIDDIGNCSQKDLTAFVEKLRVTNMAEVFILIFFDVVDDERLQQPKYKFVSKSFLAEIKDIRTKHDIIQELYADIITPSNSIDDRIDKLRTLMTHKLSPLYIEKFAFVKALKDLSTSHKKVVDSYLAGVKKELKLFPMLQSYDIYKDFMTSFPSFFKN